MWVPSEESAAETAPTCEECTAILGALGEVHVFVDERSVSAEALGVSAKPTRRHF